MDDINPYAPDIFRPAKLGRVQLPLTKAERIIRMTCTLYGISRAELVGPRRHYYLVLARRYAAHRLRLDLGLSMTRIARALGRSDHSTGRNLLTEHAPTLAVLDRMDFNRRRRISHAAHA